MIGRWPGLRVTRSEAGAPHQRGLAEWTAQVDERALAGDAQAEWIATGLELAVPGFDDLSRGLGHGASRKANRPLFAALTKYLLNTLQKRPLGSV